MIGLYRSGFYKLIETKQHTKVLYLDHAVYAWIEPAKFGEILVVSHKPHKADCVLSLGHYFIYDVKDEPHVSDHVHLELDVGRGYWQGYLLLTGLPTDEKIRARIVPTHEVITGNATHEHIQDLHGHYIAKDRDA